MLITSVSDIAGNDPRYGLRRSRFTLVVVIIVVGMAPLWTLSVVEIGGFFTTC